MDRLRLRRIYQNSLYAIQGVFTFLKEEFSARVQIVLDIFAIGMSWYLKIDRIEWIFILSTICLGWAVEAVNSSIERLVDLTTKDHDPLAKKAKDLAASASLFVFFIAVILAVTIWGPRIESRLP